MPSERAPQLRETGSVVPPDTGGEEEARAIATRRWPCRRYVIATFFCGERSAMTSGVKDLTQWPRAVVVHGAVMCSQRPRIVSRDLVANWHRKGIRSSCPPLLRRRDRRRRVKRARIYIMVHSGSAFTATVTKIGFLVDHVSATFDSSRAGFDPGFRTPLARLVSRKCRGPIR